MKKLKYKKRKVSICRLLTKWQNQDSSIAISTQWSVCLTTSSCQLSDGLNLNLMRTHIIHYYNLSQDDYYSYFIIDKKYIYMFYDNY